MSVWKNLSGQMYSGLHRWFVEETPGLAYSRGGTPLSVHEQEQLVRRHRLSELLPYEQWNPDNGLCVNSDNNMGFILEAPPATGLDQSRLDVLAGLLAPGLPAGTCVQVILYASPVIEPLLDQWQRQRQGTLYKEMAMRRSDYLHAGGWRSLLSDQPMLLRDYRLFICASRPFTDSNRSETEQSLIRMRESFSGVLSSAGMTPQELTADSFINLISHMLNPGSHAPLRWQPEILLRDQVVDPGTILFVGRDGLGLSHDDRHAALRVFSTRQYPERWSGWQMMDMIGDLFTNNLRLPCPFMHSVSIHVIDQSHSATEIQVKTMRSTQMADSPVGRFVPIWRDRCTDWSYVSRMASSGNRLLRVGRQIVLFADQKELRHAEQRLMALFESRGWMLRADRFNVLPNFLSALPLNTGDSFIRELSLFGSYRSMLSSSIINTSPWTGEWKGTGTPLLMLFGRRGQVMHIDPFDNDQGNFNMAVAAASGAGKSFLTQEMLISLLGTGGRAWVIDSGRSYERLCYLLGGDYLDFSMGRKFCLNPFSGLKELVPQLPLLKTLLARMAAGKQPLNSLQQSILERAIRSAWDKYGQETSVTRVAEQLHEAGSETADQVGQMLYPYTDKGVYGSYFNGKANISLSNDLVVLELGALDNRPDLQQTILLLLMLHINHEMYLGDRQRRKLCVIDEAWRLMAGGDAGVFIETGYRTARKFGGSYMTITQGLDDYNASDNARAALRNSDWLFLMRQKPESLVQAQNRGCYIWTTACCDYCLVWRPGRDVTRKWLSWHRTAAWLWGVCWSIPSAKNCIPPGRRNLPPSNDGVPKGVIW